MFTNPVRIAFLTDEYVVETKTKGGLGNFTYRVTQALKDLGHTPVVFVKSKNPDTPLVMMHDGVKVVHVRMHRTLIIKILNLIETRILRAPIGGVVEYLNTARTLADALNEEQKKKPFEIIHTSNLSVTGFFIPEQKERPRLLRLSSNRDLWCKTDGIRSFGAMMIVALEKAAARKADIVYAPSQYLAAYSQRNWNIEVHVVRPPAILEHRPAVSTPFNLPEKFLFFFGKICKRKGFNLIARALPLVWQQEPGLRMVLAGIIDNEKEFKRFQSIWGKFSSHVQWLGSIQKPELYAILQKSEAVVLPSLADNLPNTVIESLLLGVPVIGSRGASIDELVEPGVNGDLISIDDEQELANAMVKVWRGDIPWNRHEIQPSAVFDEMEPAVAARNLLKLAGFG